MNEISPLVKYHVTSEEKIREVVIYYMGQDIDIESNIGDSGYPTFLSLSLKKKELCNEEIKTSFTHEKDDIFISILNRYYESCLKNTEKELISEYNSQANHRKLVSLCMIASNRIAMNSRIGPSNIIVVPNKKYVDILSPINQKIIINDTDFHKDKIFIIRSFNDNISEGLLLITTKDIENIRYIKLLNIYNKLNVNVINTQFKYILSDIGNISNMVQIIILK